MSDDPARGRTSGDRSAPSEIEGVLHLEPIEPVQRYEMILARMVDSIRRGFWKPGDRLPSERTLAAQLNVSRPTVREAIAALQTEGVLETRRGSGSYVSDRAQDIISKHKGSAFRESAEPGSPLQHGLGAFSRDVSPVALLEVREILDPAVGALAASRFRHGERFEELLALMGQPLDLSDPNDRKVWSESDRLFHRELAVVTNNPIVTSIADFVAAVMAQPLWKHLRDHALSVPGRMEQYVREHSDIFNSVREGDAEGASYFARRHVKSVRQHMGLE
jgi:DNA-binding FadR family transcriptional regulator